MLIPILLLVAVFLLSHYYLTKNLKYWKTRNVPGPSPHIFVGNFPSIFNRKIHMIEEFTQIYREYRKKAAVVGIFRGVSPDLLIVDPAVIKQILITSFKHFPNQRSILALNQESDPIIGRNPFWLVDNEWRESRTAIVPAFSTARIKANWPAMQVVFNRMSKFIDDSMPVEGGLDNRELCNKYTTDVVASVLYGIESGAFEDPNSKIRELARNVLAPNWRLTSLMMMAPIFPVLAKIFKVRLMPEKYANFMTQLLRQTLQYRQEHNIDRQDFIDFLINLRDKKGLDEHSLVAHTASFFFDGVDTSGLVLASTLHELAKHPRVQTKLREQLRAIKGPNGFEYDSITDCKYLEAVVYEAMRLYPVAPTLARSCVEDCELQLSADKTISVPRGMSIWVAVRDIQRDAQYYENPDEFYPERFDKQGIKYFRDKCVLLAFGEGPRTCVGQRFGLTQIKSCIANILDNYLLTVDPRTPETLTYNPDELNMLYNETVYLRFKRH